ncbi:Crp/Fnr family transcriptional regulator [Roseovarius sp. MMSF_3281]|uniref:Crp/Fnr family transcriptional regulator n=1 Tax=Roseovarius sp. MMSF_3281 TaxID=3046694 RepID=UPI00273F0F7A|nr:Crp/Fnr family transcriptional regulator [Roseovarius sp. MMSF_3281]
MNFSQGQTVLMQGDLSDKIGILRSGVIKTVFMTEDGDTQVLGLLFPGDFTGRAFESEYRFSYEAATDVEICLFNRRSFEAFLMGSPMLEHGYLLSSLRQMDMMHSWTCLLRGRTARERVAAYFLFSALHSGECDTTIDTCGPNPIVGLRLNRCDLSSLLDMTPETFCRCLHGLADKGAVHVRAPNRIELVDMERLRHFAGPPLEGLVEGPKLVFG